MLVVVSVIGMLMALAFPALLRVRRAAQSITCRSNLRQLGVVFRVYASDHGGALPAASGAWQPTLGLLSYDERNDLLFCPRAGRFSSEGGRHPFAAYNAFSFGDTLGGGDPGALAMPQTHTGYGSYGLNGWVCNPPASVRVNPRGFSTSANWRRVDVKGSSAAPLLLDASWVDGYPHHTDPPPSSGPCTSESAAPPLGVRGGMDVFHLDRHKGFVCGVFLDLSARRIRLEGLWDLKWHRRFETEGLPQNQPAPVEVSAGAHSAP